MFANLSGTCPTPDYYAQTLNTITLSTVDGNQVGPFDPTELILYFVIHSNSSSPRNHDTKWDKGGCVYSSIKLRYKNRNIVFHS